MAAVAAVALSLWRPRNRPVALATFTLGLCYVAYPFRYETSVLQYPFVLAGSVYLVAVGGACLVVAGAVRLLANDGPTSRRGAVGDEV